MSTPHDASQMPEHSTALTALLQAHARGETGAFERLLSKVYDDLCRLAHFKLRERPAEVLDSRALVHETYLKLAGQTHAVWRDGGHFRAAFAQAMRHILVDAARQRLSEKKGGGRPDKTLTDALALVGEERHAEKILSVNQVLEQLRELDERLVRVVECRFFVGMTENETAECLDISVRTVHRDWLRARAWLRQRLGGTDLGGIGP